MQINADLGQRAAVDSTMLDWVGSPLTGVDRRMLERDGAEIARATSLVRYAPDSSFKPHVHGGGEEFLVLDGVFSDEFGDYGPGAYVRNPPGSRHTPSSKPGCTILVKLWQMHPSDQTARHIDTSDPRLWLQGPDGARILPLHSYASERVALFEYPAGAMISWEHVPRGLEMFVLEGDVEDAEGANGPGYWLRLPPGTPFNGATPSGLRVYLKTGHLADLPPGPADRARRA